MFGRSATSARGDAAIEGSARPGRRPGALPPRRRRIEAGETRDQDADEEHAGELLDHHERARLVGHRRDVAEARRRERREAEVEEMEEGAGFRGPTAAAKEPGR